MMLTESQQNMLDIVNRNLHESNDSHDQFMDAMVSLLDEGVDVQTALLEIYGTELE